MRAKAIILTRSSQTPHAMRPDSRRHGQSAPEDEDDFLEPPSKSSRKRDMHALQDLGEQLVALSPERLKKVPCLMRCTRRSAPRRASKMEARRRQLQYVGKLMRKVDPEPRPSSRSLPATPPPRSRRCTASSACEQLLEDEHHRHHRRDLARGRPAIPAHAAPQRLEGARGRQAAEVLPRDLPELREPQEASDAAAEAEAEVERAADQDATEQGPNP